MSNTADILERKVIHSGKVFIREGEENARAYIIQVGHVKAFIMHGDDRIDVAEYGPGDMICEVALVIDEPAQISYETTVDTTVITVTRQDFQKKMLRMDKSVKTILDHMSNKLQNVDRKLVDKAGKGTEIDEKAFALMRSITLGLSPDKKYEYEAAILPHVNALVKVVKELKTKERHARQAAQLEQKLNKIQTAE